MGFLIGNGFLEVTACVLLTLVLAAAIFFWGRGILRSRRSDLIAGPSILAALCLALLALSRSSGVFGIVGGLVAVFGLATLLLGAMVRPGNALRRRDILAIGAGAMILGFSLCLII